MSHPPEVRPHAQGGAGAALPRRRVLQLSGVATVGAALPALGGVSAQASSSVRTVDVDTRVVTGAFNRALFSCTGYAQLKLDGSALALDSYRQLNPVGTQARIEVMMNQASPARGEFRPDQMLRFVDNTGDAYVNHVDGLGMEPVLLCAYNTGWLTQTGALNEAPTDPRAWADIVANVVSHFNGEGTDPDYRLRVRYVEVWNEPNLEQFWLGSDEEYFELFRITADLIHARFPGVLVGGPVFSPGIEGYYDYGKAFIDAAGEHMDFFVYHSYGDTPAKVVADLRLWESYIRDHTTKADPKLMVTESESFFDSAALKVQDLLGRQFSLIENSGHLLGWHQFTLLEYREGTYTFGLVRRDGSVFDRNYWPYWLFRDVRGETLRVWTQGARSRGEHVVATRDEDGRGVSVVYWRDPALADGSQPTRFTMELPGDGRDRILVVSMVSGTSGQVVAARRVDGHAGLLTETVRLAPGVAVAHTLVDAGDARVPWLGLAASAPSVTVGSTFTATARLVNTTPAAVSGVVRLIGLPGDWQVRLVSGAKEFADLETGGVASAAWEISATSAATDIAYHADVQVTGADATHSIPLRINATAS
ncbi:GH39 family glycosyl hydrolase [Actinopolymorpha rutila]|uniref:Glycosyl hydrolases family 39 N-terminal catalytic domain-containing protein n=1 Tax=Actinopolymorpha rutila TaxID=446787 RepID=A0A852ZUX1_9ACTN|nr:hypothetical protein [Actinopolymorpha rutila]NYH92496.1 hypothetical protein [Actinopolymorpha rutila]